MTFIEAANATQLPVENGIQALEAQDRGCVACDNGTSLTGSVNMDEAYRRAEPHSNRWDYGLGFSKGATEYAVWIEPHSATSPREIDTMLRKLQWLKDKLATDEFEMLRKLTVKTQRAKFRQFWWVVPGKIGFRQGTSDSKRLAMAGLNFPCRTVTLGRD